MTERVGPGQWGPTDGGGGGGGTVVRAFPFAFDTAGLANGYEIFTPTVGDVLLDAWFEIDTAWNGTTPKGDFGYFPTATKLGFFSYLITAVNMLNADSITTTLPGFLLNHTGLGTEGGSSPALSIVGANISLTSEPAVYPTVESIVTQANNHLVLRKVTGRLFNPIRESIGKFATATPLKICVSTDGTTGGATPGATQGAAILYLVTATPL